jgi:hypothetical protein
MVRLIDPHLVRIKIQNLNYSRFVFINQILYVLNCFRNELQMNNKLCYPKSIKHA